MFNLIYLSAHNHSTALGEIQRGEIIGVDLLVFVGSELEQKIKRWNILQKIIPEKLNLFCGSQFAPGWFSCRQRVKQTASQ